MKRGAALCSCAIVAALAVFVAAACNDLPAEPHSAAADNAGAAPAQPLKNDRRQAEPTGETKNPEVLSARSLVASGESQPAYNGVVRPFIERYCVRCHGASKHETDLRLDRLQPDFANLGTATVWTEMMHRMNAGEMPPEGEPQPDPQQLNQVAMWIARQVRRHDVAGRSAGQHAVVRRMSRFEYNNTIRDLVGIDFDPAAAFPADPPAHGFDHIGAAQHVSPLQIEQYISAAREVIDRAVVTGPRPPSILWRFEAEDPQKPGVGNATFRQDWQGNRVRIFIRTGVAEEIREGMLVLAPQRGFSSVNDIHFPEGDYLIRVRAAADVPSRAQVVESAIDLARRSPDSQHELERFTRHFQNDLLYQYGPPRMKLTATFTGRTLAELDVDAPIEEPRIYEIRVRMPGIQNGMQIANSYHMPGIYQIHRVSGAGAFPRPQLLVDWFEIEGPVVDDWPLPSHQEILFPSANRQNERAYAREVLGRFMKRAWRRPVADQEVNDKLALFEHVRRTSPTLEEALKLPLIAILSSPHFFYLAEPALAAGAENLQFENGTRRLTDYELANRLSYFLWSSMPDDELFDLADRRLLSDPGVLLQQVDRMLADAKCRSLAENFGGQWLGLGKVGANPPSPEYFRRYDDHLQESMIRESVGFFAEILQNDLDARNFIKSDFVTINERLARFYGIPGVRGDRIRRVEVPPGVRRGGLVTQGSILTITSNGTRTSPVLRGKWILENLLGSPTPPPPPNAGEIAQQVPGLDKITVRQRLELHRRVPACAVCHEKIDPLGFALENFRGDGSWAEKEGYGWHGYIDPRDPAIDSRATLPDGREVNGVEELQQALLARDNDFLHCLAGKMATYALGRGMTDGDQEWLGRLVEAMQSEGHTLRGLIKNIVKSEAFRTKQVATSSPMEEMP